MDVHTNSALTTVSTAYIQRPNWLADRIFPVVPVLKQSDFYYTYNKDDWFRSVAGVRAPATESPGGGWQVSKDTYYASVYAVHKDLDDQTRANQDAQFNLDRDAVEWVTMNLMIKRDAIFVSKYLVAGVWGRDRTGVAGVPAGLQFKQWDQAGSTPIDDILAERLIIKQTTGFVPNTLVLGAQVMQTLLRHPTVIELIKYTQTGIPTEDLLAGLFRVDRVVDADTVENIAPEGGAFSASFQVGKVALLCYSAPSPGLLRPSAGYIFGWTGLLGSGAVGSTISKFRMPAIKSDRVEGEMAWDMKLVGADLGTFWSAAVA